MRESFRGAALGPGLERRKMWGDHGVFDGALTGVDFSDRTPGCCDNELPFEWSVSDLIASDVPNWGNQGGSEGPGDYRVTGPFTLQTYTVVLIPEPSGSVLPAVLRQQILLASVVNRILNPS